MNKYSITFLLLSMLFISADKREQPYNEIGYTQEGNASYYADKFHGRKTASGEPYDMYDMTAAHPRIKFNTKIKVTNLNNDKSIVVRINDRGPYSGGRIIDLSKKAAEKLDMIRAGVILVKTEVVDTEEFVIAKKDEDTDENPTIELEKTKESAKKKAEEKVRKTKVGRLLDRVFNKKKSQEPKRQEKPKNNGSSEQKSEETKQNSEKSQTNKEQETKPRESQSETKTTNKPKGGTIDKPQPIRNNKSNEEKFAGVNTFSLWGTIKYPNGFGVQIGSYTTLDKALEKGKAIYEKGFKDVFIQTGWAGKNRIFRILVGEGSNETVAAMIPKLRTAGYSGGFVKQHY